MRPLEIGHYWFYFISFQCWNCMNCLSFIVDITMYWGNGSLFFFVLYQRCQFSNTLRKKEEKRVSFFLPFYIENEGKSRGVSFFFPSFNILERSQDFGWVYVCVFERTDVCAYHPYSQRRMCCMLKKKKRKKKDRKKNSRCQEIK